MVGTYDKNPTFHPGDQGYGRRSAMQACQDAADYHNAN